MDKEEVKKQIKAEADYWLGLMAAHGVGQSRVTRLGEKMRELLAQL